MRAASALLLTLVTACTSGGDGASPTPTPNATPAPSATPGELDLADLLDPALFEYAWSCEGEVALGEEAPAAEPPSEDCSAGVWPELDSRVEVCPTISERQREDPVSGLTLPLADDRPLPVALPLSESGDFVPTGAPVSWPAELKVVTWNLEYSSHPDAQIELLSTHPELGDADLYLLSEVDRCSRRNGVRRVARELAERIEAAYVYGIEFVELSIGRELGGDTGQAIVSRRPLRNARLSCHSAQYDWFADDGEPRLGQRVYLHADIPIGDRWARAYAVHLESNDLLGEKRVVQMRELLDDAQQLACDRPQLIGGDFNSPYESSPVQEVMRKSGFVDAVAEAGDTRPTHAGVTANAPGFRLDYIWTRGLEIIDGGVIKGVGFSDHDPVWLRVRLP